jgi:pantoate--beta-alanine ligase
MQILKNISDIKTYLKQHSNKSIGLIPTMGALHQGHMRLVKKSQLQNDLSIVSIFVNPTQFNNLEDLEAYPNQLKQDCLLLEQEGVGAVFVPDKKIMYPDAYLYQVHFTDELSLLEGKNRPGHFTGMLTIVLKLLCLVQADHAYFGEKDAEQLALVQGLASAFFLKTKIIPVKTVRDKFGLAFSSRNKRLTQKQVVLAQKLNCILKKAKTDSLAIQELERLEFKIEYVETRKNKYKHVLERHAAVFLGDVRLIDHVGID